jgi:hypothetical protein
VLKPLQSSIRNQCLFLFFSVDGSVEPGMGRKREAARDSNGRENDSQGRLIETDQWDNHNTIARGWLTAGEDNYHPVTFRRLYGVEKQFAPSPLPKAARRQSTPYQEKPVQAQPVGDEPAVEENGTADL